MATKQIFPITQLLPLNSPEGGPDCLDNLRLSDLSDGWEKADQCSEGLACLNNASSANILGEILNLDQGGLVTSRIGTTLYQSQVNERVPNTNSCDLDSTSVTMPVTSNTPYGQHVPIAGYFEHYDSYALNNKDKSLIQTYDFADPTPTWVVNTTYTSDDPNIEAHILAMWIYYIHTPQGKIAVARKAGVDEPTFLPNTQNWSANSGIGRRNDDSIIVDWTLDPGIPAGSNLSAELWLGRYNIDITGGTNPPFVTTQGAIPLLLATEKREGDGAYELEAIPSISEVAFGYELAFHPSYGQISTVHNGRLWTSMEREFQYLNIQAWPTETNNNANGIARGISDNHAYGLVSDFSGLASAVSNFTLVYSPSARLNMHDGYVTLNAKRSNKITGMVSLPPNQFGQFGGLLVFADNEVFTVSGDPALPDSFGVNEYPGGFGGMDEGTFPAIIGDTAFSIYKGEIHSYQQGNVSVITKQLTGVRFIQLSADIAGKRIIGIGEDGINGVARVYVFDIETSAWHSTCTCLELENPVLVSNLITDNKFIGQDVNATLPTKVYALGTVTENCENKFCYYNINVGQPSFTKRWQTLRFFTKQPFPDQLSCLPSTIRANLCYCTNGEVAEIEGKNIGNQIKFQFPHGVISSEISFDVKVTGLGKGQIVAPILIEYSIVDDSC